MAESKGLASLPRRFYECVICKGSFSCWRALGGHMKIHRKEPSPYDQAAGLLSQPTLASLLAPCDQATGFSLTFPPSSARPRRVKHSFIKTQFKLNKGERFKAVEAEAAEVGEGLDLELRLG
ncbi:zinc finger protein 1-like [Cryptomeria japonica]|uniref:zinc finger protein 1-like n=1 Tax=Cryptomeria japonica TaxID=3369 RepID=UPI0027DA8439|nr:zinc finger protein 1-like [Cryptomeria japonica]